MRRFAMGDVSVADMAAAREARAMRQQRLLMQRGALVCLTMNIPGPHKTSPLIAVAFEEGKRLIAQTLPGAALAHELRDKTGFEAYYQAADDPLTVKRALCTVEDTTPLGRLFDIDVLTPAGDKVSREALGLPPRQCFLCGNPAFVCARSRAHSVQALTAEIDRRILALYRERTIAHLSRAAVEALEQEARTTPKPGLVDARNCGSHPDMSLPLLLRSAHALAGYFAQCAALGFDCAEVELFPALQTAGMQAEADMLAATGGVNTHKGAVFSLGVLCAAAAQCAARFEDTPQAVCQTDGCAFLWRAAVPAGRHSRHSRRSGGGLPIHYGCLAGFCAGSDAAFAARSGRSRGDPLTVAHAGHHAFEARGTGRAGVCPGAGAAH